MISFGVTQITNRLSERNSHCHLFSLPGYAFPFFWLCQWNCLQGCSLNKTAEVAQHKMILPEAVRNFIKTCPHFHLHG